VESRLVSVLKEDVDWTLLLVQWSQWALCCTQTASLTLNNKLWFRFVKYIWI
jgi:hypothetical protein